NQETSSRVGPRSKAGRRHNSCCSENVPRRLFVRHGEESGYAGVVPSVVSRSCV
ncbi:Hypothetical protein FKW44_006390, partial [Caligus rogercresseyi]